MAQKAKVHIDFEIIEEKGPAHKKEFVTKCIFGDSIIEGVGASKKKSKHDAAEKMLEIIKSDSSKSGSAMEFYTTPKKKSKKKTLIKSGMEKFARDAKSFVTSTWQYAFPDDQSDNVSC